MDIFGFLEDDNTHTSHRLNEAAKHYSDWARDRVFEESKKALALVEAHFSRDALLEQNLKNNGSVKSILDEVQKQREAIDSEIEHIVEIHVDEPGYEQALESIAAKFNQYAKYCHDTFYPAMKKALSADELKHVNEQLEEKAFLS